MGTIRKFTCPDCDWTWQVNLGHGIRHATLESVLTEFPEEMHPAILADSDGSPTPIFDFQYRAAHCPQCNKIISLPVISIGGTVHAGSCPHCGSKPELLKEEQSLHCPQCGSTRLAGQNMGHWD